jgi:hypothetical protein
MWRLCGYENSRRSPFDKLRANGGLARFAREGARYARGYRKHVVRWSFTIPVACMNA